jgi:hypothetical protein
MLTYLRRGTPGTILTSLLLVVGCGKAPLSDDQTGSIDLVPFYKSAYTDIRGVLVPGATTANPNAGLPLIIAPKRGWANGVRIEYYDFGAVGHVRQRDGKGSELKAPAYANVYPMYFFFDSQGRPMFSKPAYDGRSGVWTMKGGHNPTNPTPVAPPTTDADRASYYGTVYLRRPRDVLFDDGRGSSDFQRPVIDTLGNNSADPTNTGLWEVVEITVNDRGYQPDSIKTAATIRAGLSDGRLSQRRTGRVINCPVVDERTNVIPSSMANNIPRPRVEVWYRTKLGQCYLVNGWETIGETIDESAPATDPANLRLFGTADFDKRVSTLDASSYTVGAGQIGETQSVTAAVGKLYMPTLSAGSAVFRYANDDLAVALPRHKASDPGGYSPIAWLWDMNLPPAPPYQAGSVRDIATVDLTTVAARDVATTVWTNNVAIIGAATACTTDADCKWGMGCNLMPDDDIAATVPDAGTNVVDMMIAREGGPRCDVPAVGYGQYCARGVSRCEVQSPSGGDNESRLKTIGVAVAGPTFTVHADQKAAQAAFDTATSISQGVDPKDPIRVIGAAEQAAAMASLPGLQSTLNAANTKAAYYDGFGYTTDFGGYGYFCYPPVLGTSNPPTLGGFCHIRCDAGASATASSVTVDLLPGDPGELMNVYAGEARCGGLNMLGYKCLPTTAGYPDRERVCMRVCNQRNTLNQSAAVCSYPFNQTPDASGNPNTSFSLSKGQPARSAIVGQACVAISSTVATCNWTPDFEPRDPAEWTAP